MKIIYFLTALVMPFACVSAVDISDANQEQSLDKGEMLNSRCCKARHHGCKNDRRGPPGPQGPQGIQGIQGIQGVPGENATREYAFAWSSATQLIESTTSDQVNLGQNYDSSGDAVFSRNVITGIDINAPGKYRANYDVQFLLSNPALANSPTNGTWALFLITGDLNRIALDASAHGLALNNNNVTASDRFQVTGQATFTLDAEIVYPVALVLENVTNGLTLTISPNTGTSNKLANGAAAVSVYAERLQ